MEEEKIDNNLGAAVIGLFLLLVVVIFHVFTNFEMHGFGESLQGECFVTIKQEHLSPQGLAVNSSEFYVFSINGNCQAMYEGCNSLYQGFNLTCILRGNVCGCV